MSFIPDMNQTRIVHGVGNPNAKIAIVGDFTSAFDNNAMKPFQGGAGDVLEQCLHLAGLIKGECYLTNCIKSKPVKRCPPKSKDGAFSEFFLDSRRIFTPEGTVHVERLRDELNASGANVIVACGKASAVALAGLSAVSTYRGYVFPSVGLDRIVKVIPTHHPGAAIRGMYTYRHMITCDLKKAKIESEFPELIRPERHLVYEYSTVDEALQWIDYFMNSERLSVDIEVINFEVSCINLSNDPAVACVIPIADRWTEEEELLIWRALARLLGTEGMIKVLQNGIFDIHFMLSRYGLEIRGPIEDTMIAHSCMFPELPKGLGFLGSIYCGSQEYWKDMVKFNDIKENS